MYELSFLFWYKIIFATELLVSIFLFCFKLPLKNKPLLRIGASLLIYYGVAFAIPIGSFSYNFYYVSFVFFLIFAVSIPLLKLIFDAPWISIVFCTMAAYTTQHFTYEAFNFFENIFGVSQQNGIFGYGKGEQLDTIFNPVVLSIYFCTYADIYWLFYVLFGRKIKRNDELKLKQTSLLIVLMALLAVDVIFNAYLTFYSADNYNSTYMMFEELYNMICCIVILEVQFVFVKEKELEQQVSFYSNLLAEQKKHYEQDKANIERMNIKAHDLKHQIMALGSKGSISKDELEDISEAVSLYDKSYQTDNEALNIVLMEKQNVCYSNRRHAESSWMVPIGLPKGNGNCRSQWPYLPHQKNSHGSVRHGNRRHRQTIQSQSFPLFTILLFIDKRRIKSRKEILQSNIQSVAKFI